MPSELIIRICGTAGQGVDLAGIILTNTCAAAKFHVFTNAEHYNSIKGGHNSFQLRMASRPVWSHGQNPHILIAMDPWALESAIASKAKYVLYDLGNPPDANSDIHWLHIPMRKIAQDAGNEVMKNMVCIGACAALCSLPIDELRRQISRFLNKKNEQVVAQNMESAALGFAYAEQNFPSYLHHMSAPQNIGPLIVSNGNTLAALGAIRAGCKFVAAYPMTPSSTILHVMADHANTHELSVHHVEDEIAAATMAIGAGIAGARAMVPTSGGGYALMGEAISFAGMIEAPVVFFQVQRPGPSTGLPTRTGQGDLRQVLHAGQGCFPHIILSPSTHEECYVFARKAFDLADRYQCPVTVLMEKYLAENLASLPQPQEPNYNLDRGELLTEKQLKNLQPFRRYQITPDGISPRSLPGQNGGIHTASSYEHREDGSGTEDPSEVAAQNAKRMRKMEAARAKTPDAIIHGSAEAELTLICWGGTTGAAREAAERLTNNGIATNCLPIKHLSPLPPNMQDILKKIQRPVLVEGNILGLLGGLLRQHTGIVIQDRILDASGRPFTADYIEQAVHDCLNAQSL